jgi:hypothetical protein
VIPQDTTGVSATRHGRAPIRASTVQSSDRGNPIDVP